MFSIDRSKLTMEQRQYISTHCTCKKSKTSFDDSEQQYYLFKVENEEVRLPLKMWKICHAEFPNNQGKPINISFNANLLTAETDPSGRKRDQTAFVNEIATKLLKDNVALGAAYTGFGKTATGVYMAHKIGLKTMIITYLSKIHDGWKESFEKWTNAKVQLISSLSKMDPEADVYIVGVEKASKGTIEQFKDIGFVIFDECHMSTIKAFTVVAFLFKPKYVLGMSATPDARKDGMDKLLEVYFGEPILRKEQKPMTVIKYCTRYSPKMVFFSFKGERKPNWNAMIGELSENRDRWESIATIIKRFINQKVLVLCARITACHGIAGCLNGIQNVYVFTGSEKTFPSTTRVLISTAKKVGTGFDWPGLSVLVLEAESTDARQMVGRLRDMNGTVIDIVDKYNIGENHWKKRLEFYNQINADIKIEYEKV